LKSGDRPCPASSSLRDFRTLLILFVGLRLVVLIGRDIGGLMHFGDFSTLYSLAEITQETGRLPFVGYWSEYPPVFVWINLGLHRLLIVQRGLPDHTYYYALALLNVIADCGNLWLIYRLGERLYGPDHGPDVAWVYALLGMSLVLMTWTFEAVTEFFMLLGLWLLLEGKESRSAVAIAAGVLTKVMPGLLTPVVWRFRPPRRAAIYTAIIAALGVLAYLPFYVISPAFTLASLRSQLGKSSWQTVWALLDGNFGTGSFGPLLDRLDPARVDVMLSNPPLIPGWVTLVVFGALYVYLFTRPMRRTDRALVAFFGVTWCVFLLWARGWSPQWMAMVIPLMLLVFPSREGVLAVLLFGVINFLEWPVMLSRGITWGLYVTVPLRTLFVVGMLVAFFRQCRASEAPASGCAGSETVIGAAL
jgi:hypothetical protein